MWSEIKELGQREREREGEGAVSDCTLEGKTISRC